MTSSDNVKGCPDWRTHGPDAERLQTGDSPPKCPGSCTIVSDPKFSQSAILLSNQNTYVDALQEANANLVITSLEAHKVAEDALGRLHHQAYHDALTDLPNRTLLWDRLCQAIELARRQGKQLALLFMDLDGFKHINDSLGHPVGDELLKLVASRLLNCARHSDTVSRQGGDEFVILLPTIESPEDAMAFAEKTLHAFEAPYQLCAHELYIGVSMGISVYPVDGTDAATLVKNADTAMYHAKQSGGNNWKFFEQTMNDRAVERQFIEAGLRLALQRQEFVLYYQPKIKLASGTIVGAEALIRWQHPDRGLLLPTQFVAIAEECGLIVPIGQWVIREACAQARAWQQAGLPPITIAVNSSAIEFRARDFVENLRSIVDATAIEPGSLEVEVTESVLMQNIDSTMSVLHAIAAMGIKLSIDDFGTGYSSLNYLSRFPINTLKIDQTFINEISPRPENSTIVSAIINMARSLNRRVIAEGVETKEQHDFLRSQHCDEAQGNYFSPPLSAENFARLLHRSKSA